MGTYSFLIEERGRLLEEEMQVAGWSANVYKIKRNETVMFKTTGILQTQVKTMCCTGGKKF